MELLEVMAEESGKLGLKINFNKTKIMPISKEVNSESTIKFKDQEIDVVAKFVYLGSEMKAEGGSDSGKQI